MRWTLLDHKLRRDLGRPRGPTVTRGIDTPLPGRVVRVEPSAFARTSALGVEEQRVNVVVALHGAAPAGAVLGDGFRVEASITLWAGGEVLLVPHGALFRAGEVWAVYVVEGRRARRREVTTGHAGDRATEVTRDLRGGETVVVHPPDSVRDGTPVAPEPAR